MYRLDFIYLILSSSIELSIAVSVAEIVIVRLGTEGSRYLRIFSFLNYLLF